MVTVSRIGSGIGDSGDNSVAILSHFSQGLQKIKIDWCSFKQNLNLCI